MSESKQLTLWQVIDRLKQQVPFTKDGVETALSSLLTLQGRSEAVDYYESQPIPLAGGVIVDEVDLRVNRAGLTSGFLVLELSGACVSQSQIRSHFSPVYLSSLPDSPSPERLKFYSTDVSWGKLHFGFKQGNPDCLATLSFDPSEDMSLSKLRE